MSSLLSAELAATCNALGSLDKRTGKYLIDEFTLDTVKDLIRYLRRDDEDHEIRRHLGQTKVLETDLLPILINHSEVAELFDVTLRLVVNLTNPPLLLYREEIPTEKSGRRCYLQLVSHLSSYKANSFTGTDVWTVLAKRLTQILEIDSGERDEDSGLIIERILILVRNILHVPVDDHDEKRPDNDASVHDQVLWALNQSGLLDVILYMSSENERPYFMHILEIISLLLREQNPTSLADAALQRSVDEKLKDEQELLSIRSSEIEKRTAMQKQFSANRHSRFGGTFIVQNMKSISDNNLICHKPLNKVTNVDFSLNKDRIKKPKNRRPASDVTSGERRSAFAIRLFLKEFCIEFLNVSYNTMMYYVKDVLVRSKAQKNDETYYMWAMKFFMEFNRNYNFQVKLVSETMSVSTFHYVQQQMEKCYEMLMMDKKKTAEWVRRLHLSLKAYNELLQTMTAMDKSLDKSVCESSKVLKSNIFYVLEYREFIHQIIVSYDESKMPRAYLKDLMETVHIFLRMLEQFCSKHGLVVQKKVRSKAAKKGKKKQLKKPQSKQVSEETKNIHWNLLSQNLVEVVSGDKITTEFIPFDATLDKDIDEQKGDCMKKIQKLFSENRLSDAVGLLRAGREVWPENDIFGNESMPPHEEIDVMKLIYMANIGAEQIEVPQDQSEEESNNEDEEDEEEEERSAHIVEADFSFDDFINRFATPKIVKACSILLQTFDKNSSHTNHCTIKMLHRIAWDCKQPPMLFQACLFRTFQRILDSNLMHHKEMQKFIVFIIRKFTEVGLKNPKVFMELLFWKSSQDAYVIENGYDEAENQNKKGNVTWSEEQEEELRKLYNENQSNPTTDIDVIDWILDNLVERNRTRRGVILKLKELGLIFRAPTKKSNAKQAVPKEFGEDEDEQLRILWKELAHTNDPLGGLIPRMPLKRPKFRFVDRLLELGLIFDKKECKKKRSKKSNGDHTQNSDSEEDNPKSPVSQGTQRSSKAKTKRPAKKSISKSKTNVSSSAVSGILISCVDAGFTEALKWVCESLEEVALDQEAEGCDGGESVPLVPIMSECVEAMENSLFLQALKCLGLEPPSDEQECSWRIPGHIHFEALRKRCVTITKAIEKTLLVPEETNDYQEINNTDTLSPHQDSPNNENNHGNSSSDEDADDFFNRIRRMDTSNTNTNKSPLNKRKRGIVSEDDEEMDDNEPPYISKKHKTENSESQAEKTVNIDIISNSAPEDSNESSSNTNIRVLKKNKKQVLSDSDDSDEGTNKHASFQKQNDLNSNDHSNSENSKTQSVLSEDNEHAETSRMQLSEEDEPPVNLRNKRKKKHFILSDSEDSMDIPTSTQITSIIPLDFNLSTIHSEDENDVNAVNKILPNNYPVKTTNLTDALFDSLVGNVENQD